MVVAAVELDRGGGISVAVRDSSQRSEGRVVSDASLAAAWIDSWLRDDFETPVVAFAGLDPRASTAGDVVERMPPRHSSLDQFSIAATFEQAWSDDRSRWNGFSIAGCVMVGRVCLGGRALREPG